MHISIDVCKSRHITAAAG